MDDGGTRRKPLVWLGDEIKTPPFTKEGRKQAGRLLRIVQGGEIPPFPASRPMPSVGRRVHELRIDDPPKSWRIFYRTDDAEILVILVHEKRTVKTPRRVIDECKRRLKRWAAR